MTQQGPNLEGRLYTKEHEWVSVEGNIATIGISDFAQAQLGDIVYLDLPIKGKSLIQGQKLGEVESVKAVSDIYSPITGTVTDVNAELAAHPELANKDAEGLGWLVKATYDPGGLKDLMSHVQYKEFLSGQHH